MIEHVTGNLLEARADALVNTVNCVGVMGKGIALQFRQAFPSMYEAYRAAAKAGEVRPGSMHVFDLRSLVPPRYVINFPTRRHWRGKSRIEDIEAGLADLDQTVRRLDIRSVAVPPLGAGAGGLAWSLVRSRIGRTLAALDDVRVLVYEPRGAPPAEERPIRTKRPAFRAALSTLAGGDAALGSREAPKAFTAGEGLLPRKELDGQPLDRTDHERLSLIGEGLERILAGRGDLRLGPVPVVADVFHSGDPTTGERAPLLAATGPLDIIVVAVPLGRRVVLARGAVASFYQLMAGAPLSDDDWRARLRDDTAPPQPAWARPLPLDRSPWRSPIKRD